MTMFKSIKKRIKKKISIQTGGLIVLALGGILIIYNARNYSSRFEAEAACNESSLYCHHDKETRQILGLDYKETQKFKLGWPVIKRYRY